MSSSMTLQSALRNVEIRLVTLNYDSDEDDHLDDDDIVARVNMGHNRPRYYQVVWLERTTEETRNY